MTFIFVALGGALGAVCRYALSLVIIKSDFPFMTFAANLIGAFLIGLIAGFAKKNPSISKNFILFLKTGFCGGFTTFSTFSLETWNLLEAHNYPMAALYAGVSFVLCIAGVALGLFVSSVLENFTGSY